MTTYPCWDLLIRVSKKGAMLKHCISESSHVMYTRILQCYLTGIGMMTSSNENIVRVTGPLWGESTGRRLIPPQKASDAELGCFLWSAPEQKIAQTIQARWFETRSSSLWRHRNRDIRYTVYPLNLHTALFWCGYTICSHGMSPLWAYK